MSKKMILGTILVAAVAVAAFSVKFIDTTNGEQENIDMVDSVEVSSIKNINLNIECGDVNIISEDRNDLRTEFSAKCNKGKPDIEKTIDGDTLNIKVIQPREGNNFFKDVVLKIMVPNEYSGNLKIDEKAGEINISNINLNNININSSSGDVKLDNIEVNKFDLNSSAGDFSSNLMKSKVSTLNCNTGLIEMTEFSGDLKVVQQVGEINVQYSQFNNNLDIVSKEGGKIYVKLTNASDAALSAECTDGNVKFELPSLQVVNQKENYIEGKIGSGKNIVNLKSASGDVLVTK